MQVRHLKHFLNFWNIEFVFIGFKSNDFGYAYKDFNVTKNTKIAAYGWFILVAILISSPYLNAFIHFVRGTYSVKSWRPIFYTLLVWIRFLLEYLMANLFKTLSFQGLFG